MLICKEFSRIDRDGGAKSKVTLFGCVWMNGRVASENKCGSRIVKHVFGTIMESRVRALKNVHSLMAKDNFTHE